LRLTETRTFIASWPFLASLCWRYKPRAYAALNRQGQPRTCAPGLRLHIVQVDKTHARDWRTQSVFPD
jgi:hypothetical protein